MKIETSRVDKYKFALVDAKKYFGWQQTEEIEEKHGPFHHKYIVFARNSEIRNKDKLDLLEEQYVNYLNMKKENVKIDGSIAFICFICFIVPFIVYLVGNKIKNNKINIKNEHIDQELDKIMVEAHRLLGE